MKKNSDGKTRRVQYAAGLLVLVGLVAAVFAASSLVRIFHRGPDRRGNPLAAGVRVEVLNGSSFDGVARKAAAALREKGFDVVNIDNAESHDFKKTVVVDRVSPDMRYARLLARMIGCGEMAAQPDPSLYLEVTVILGDDCERLFPGVTRE